jgi:hypothetical protein
MLFIRDARPPPTYLFNRLPHIGYDDGADIRRLRHNSNVKVRVSSFLSSIYPSASKNKEQKNLLTRF